MSTSQVAFYTNRVGKFEKMRRYGQTERQTKPGSDRTNAQIWHIYSHTPTHKLITVHLRRTVNNVLTCATQSWYLCRHQASTITLTRANFALDVF
jgi:hypothetical protein